jgi:hypothetical protein
MKKHEMDKLRDYCSVMRKIGDPSWYGLSSLLDKLEVEPDVIEEDLDVEDEWNQWLSTAPDPLTEYDNTCPVCLGEGMDYDVCDMGHYGSKYPCEACAGTGKKDAK